MTRDSTLTHPPKRQANQPSHIILAPNQRQQPTGFHVYARKLYGMLREDYSEEESIVEDGVVVERTLRLLF
jgi:hypothetical protein